MLYTLVLEHAVQRSVICKFDRGTNNQLVELVDECGLDDLGLLSSGRSADGLTRSSIGGWVLLIARLFAHAIAIGTAVRRWAHRRCPVLAGVHRVSRACGRCSG